MTLERVPDYLAELVRRTDPEVLRELLEGERATERLGLDGIAELLATWLGDAAFWTSIDDERPDTPPTVPLEDSLDDEAEVLAAALGGDPRRARLILLEAPLRSVRPNPKQALRAVETLHRHCNEVTAEAESHRRFWRGARTMRRIFKAAGGGLLVAADIVSPDPTVILRVASIWGGADMIIDAVKT
jgi:hypothetical protein